jgi:hypothetical protein
VPFGRRVSFTGAVDAQNAAGGGESVILAALARQTECWMSL